MLVRFRLSPSLPFLAAVTQLVSPEKPAEVERSEPEDNAKTIRPTRSPHQNALSLPRKTSNPVPSPIVEDYSDLAGEDEEVHLKARVADFKVSFVDYFV